MDKKGGEKLPELVIGEEVAGQELIREKSQEQFSNTEGGTKKQKPKLPNLPQLTTQAPKDTAAKNDTSTQDSSKSSSSTNLTASDVDLIEKHWVERAKTIVAETLDDPYMQQKEMTKEKADYIKKRFNKTIPSE